VTDVQPVSSLELCEPCQEPTALRDMVLGADGIPIPLCRWCAAERQVAARTGRDPLGDCEPAWSPPIPRPRQRPRIIDLPDIDLHQEQP
jgi:hypothetical protein